MEESIQGNPDHAMTKRPHLFVTGEARLAMWCKLRGIRQGRKPNPIEELDKIRDAWDRDLPPVR
jgi:hypothetical protein